MAPRIAWSLDVLRDEFNRLAPRRSKKSDGWIGDPAHQDRPSRHNPNNAGVVCALDITHDPAGGCNVHQIARELVERAKRDNTNPNFEYVVSNRMIASRTKDWAWRNYSGDNPHTKHAHFAVGRGPDIEPLPPYDNMAGWGVYPPPHVPDPNPPTPTPVQEGIIVFIQQPGKAQGTGVTYFENEKGCFLRLHNGAKTTGKPFQVFGVTLVQIPVPSGRDVVGVSPIPPSDDPMRKGGVLVIDSLSAIYTFQWVA